MTKSSKLTLYSVVVNGVVFKGDKVLLVKRSLKEQHEPGKWTIPGGKVEEKNGDIFQVLEKSLKREITEESGVQIKDDYQLISNNTFIRSDGQLVIALVFLCTYKSGKAAFNETEDTIDCRWASLDEVKKLTFPENVLNYIVQGFKEKK